MNTILASSLPTKKFVDPEACSIPFQDIAHQNVTNLLKNENNWILKQNLGQIGWRTKKNYFKVQYKNLNSKQNHATKLESQASTSSYKDTAADEYLLSWTELGPDKVANEKDMNIILKILTKIRHPYIIPIEFIQANENGCLVVRKFYPSGSLKDFLCGSSPLNSFNSKYGNPKGRVQLPLADIALYSRQILEAIKYLHSIGLAHGHITTANIFIDSENKVARISALENFVLGVNSFYRPFLVQNAKVTSLELIDMFIFGHVLFEMQSSYSLQEPYAREFTDCPPSLKTLLEHLITKDSFKTSLPTFDKIKTHAFFRDFASTFESKHVELNATVVKQNINFDANAKEIIAKLTQKSEQRLKDEQKLVKSQKRSLASQNQKHLNEEEKRKNKTRLKSQSSLQNNNNSNSNGINFKINISDELVEPETSAPSKKH